MSNKLVRTVGIPNWQGSPAVLAFTKNGKQVTLADNYTRVAFYTPADVLGGKDVTIARVTNSQGTRKHTMSVPYSLLGAEFRKAGITLGAIQPSISRRIEDRIGNVLSGIKHA